MSGPDYDRDPVHRDSTILERDGVSSTAETRRGWVVRVELWTSLLPTTGSTPLTPETQTLYRGPSLGSGAVPSVVYGDTHCGTCAPSRDRRDGRSPSQVCVSPSDPHECFCSPPEGSFVGFRCLSCVVGTPSEKESRLCGR